jgi:hypothetical protein
MEWTQDSWLQKEVEKHPGNQMKMDQFFFQVQGNLESSGWQLTFFSGKKFFQWIIEKDGVELWLFRKPYSQI